MRRTAFRRKDPPPSLARVRQWSGPAPTPRAPPRAVLAAPRAFFAVPKECAIQHRGYEAIVRTLACARCGFFRKGLIQFCHSDAGKGTGLKTDCRRGWPGCGPHEENGRTVPGCHWYVGTSGRMTKAERRAFELTASAATRAAVALSGRWPARLPRWPA